MPLVPLFSVSQTVGAPTIVTITDTSTGSDGSITERRVYLQKTDGLFLVEDGTTTEYEVWDYADASIDLDCLDKDYGLRIVVQWVQVVTISGVVTTTILYATEGLFGLNRHNKDFSYTLSTVLAANPLLVNDNSFKQNKSDLMMLISSGDESIEESSDIASCQLCYDAATVIRLGSEYYFNESTS